MASATLFSTLVFSAMASMICDFVNAIVFSSFSIPCQVRTIRIPHHYKKWPLEGNKNKTAVEGLESGSKTTLCHPCPRNAQPGSVFMRWDNLLSSEMPGYDAGACRSCLCAFALVSWPMWVQWEVKLGKQVSGSSLTRICIFPD